VNFLSSVQGVNSGQTGASITGFAVLFPGMPALNRLEPGALPGAMAMDPTIQLLAQQQQTMQLMLTTMLSLLVGLLQGNTSNNANSNSAGSTSNAGGNTPPGAPGDKVTNAKIVAEVARQKGVDPVTAVACMLVESGGSNASTGDNGTSFGLFQLHRGGELGNMTEAEARDPRRNAEVALSVFAANKGKYSDPGQLAAASQRPADRAGYARKVDAMLPEARRLLGM
jgi:hypothetical protein